MARLRQALLKTSTENMDNADMMMMMMMMMLFLDEQKPQTSRISQGYVDSRCPHFADRTLCL